MNGTLQDLQQSQVNLACSLERKMETLTASLGDFTSGAFSLTFTPGRSRMLLQGSDSALHRTSEPASPSLRASRLRNPPAAPPEPSLADAPPIPLAGPAPCALPVLAQLAAKAPTYSMNRQASSIPQLWREWSVGLPGCPSVQELDRIWGARWRASAKERQFYSLRKVIVEELRRRAEEHDGEGDMETKMQAAVDAMERERNLSGASLDKVAKVLKADRKKQGDGLP